jgi:hypothetical protein
MANPVDRPYSENMMLQLVCLKRAAKNFLFNTRGGRASEPIIEMRAYGSATPFILSIQSI